MIEKIMYFQVGAIHRAQPAEPRGTRVGSPELESGRGSAPPSGTIECARERDARAARAERGEATRPGVHGAAGRRG